MVTVAKSLDVPIKLVFPRPGTPEKPSSEAMLGLGDVVLPGIMIGLALRFDLFLFYLRQQKKVTASNKGTKDLPDTSEVEKARYFSFAGRWTDHFWTHSLLGRPLFQTSKDNKSEAPFTFPKTYFRASLVGYVIGMLMTLAVMQVWGHAQPALLYLVPGVLGSLWLTALFRGELSLMWGFTEAEEEELSEDGKSTSGTASERTSFFSLSDKKAQDLEARMKKSMEKHITVESDGDEEADSSKTSKVKDVVGHKSNREVFSFSIEAPWNLKHPRSIRKNSRTESADVESPTTTKDDGIESIPVDQNEPIQEPAKKRSRLR